MSRHQNNLHDAGVLDITCRVQPTGRATREDELSAALIRVLRQIKSLVGADTAVVPCLATLMRGGPMRVSALAAELGLDVSTASRHVSRLEANGLIARTPDPSDQRATMLALTPAGVDRMDVHLRHRADVLRAATKSWAESDVAALIELINRLADDIGTAAAPGENA
jgi:DNA-binding MarR family transcriptional regulator